MHTPFEQNSPSKSHKVNISFVLNLPVNLELEILNIPAIRQQVEGQDFSIPNMEYPNSKIKINSDATNIQVDSSQLIAQITSALQENNHQFKAEENITIKEAIKENLAKINDSQVIKLESKNLANKVVQYSHAEESRIQPQSKNKKLGRVLDVFNDGLTFTINIMGMAMRQGKIANYSWD